MKCLHCGYCCIMYDVVIVKPEYVSEKLVLTEDNFGDILVHKPNNEVCPHLYFQNDQYFCRIHDYEWYKETPCFRHSQIEQKNSNCRIGERVKYDFAVQKKLKQLYLGGEIEN